MIGQRFHFLLVQEEIEPVRYARHVLRRFRCLCDCGNQVEVQGQNLRTGRTKSCGCWKKMTAGFGRKSHGQSASAEYGIWIGIKKRCYNPAYREFDLYGGRGIAMSDAWKESFESFIQDMGSRPTPAHSIDRIDGNGDYTKENCRWATDLEQGANTRRVKLVHYDGHTFNLRQFARHLGHSYWTVYDWIARRGLTAEEVAAKLSAAR